MVRSSSSVLPDGSRFRKLKAGMHSAPSVICPVGRSRFAGWLALMLWSAGALLALHAIVPADRLGIRQALLVGTVIATGITVAWAWWHAPCGTLSWDGSNWRWQNDALERVGVLSIALDLQRRLLVRFVAADGAVHWLWLESDKSGGSWHALRCAVHGHAVGKVCKAAFEPAAASAKP